MMSAGEGGDVNAVSVHGVSRLARSLYDFERTVPRVTDTGGEIPPEIDEESNRSRQRTNTADETAEELT